MYCTLDGVGAAFKEIDAKGTCLAIQIDSRSSKEVSEDIDHSIIFEILRAEAARIYLSRTYPNKEQKVMLQYREKPPQKIIDIGTTLGTLSYGGNVVKKSEKDVDIEKEINKAMDNVGKRFAGQYKLDINLKNLRKADDIILSMKLNKEKGEEVYWRTVLGFAAFAGLALKRDYNCAWVVNRGWDVIPPIGFVIKDIFKNIAEEKESDKKKQEEATFFLVGKAMKLIENGKGDSIGSFLETMLNPMMLREFYTQSKTKKTEEESKG